VLSLPYDVTDSTTGLGDRDGRYTLARNTMPSDIGTATSCLVIDLLRGFEPLPTLHSRIRWKRLAHWILWACRTGSS